MEYIPMWSVYVWNQGLLVILPNINTIAAPLDLIFDLIFILIFDLIFKVLSFFAFLM